MSDDTEGVNETGVNFVKKSIGFVKKTRTNVGNS